MTEEAKYHVSVSYEQQFSHLKKELAELKQHLDVRLNHLEWLMNLSIHQEKTIMANQEELAAALETVNTQLQKAMEEIIAAIAAAGTSTPRVDAAVSALQAAAQALDDLNPDNP